MKWRLLRGRFWRETSSDPLSAHEVGGEGGARAKRGRVRWVAAFATERSRAYLAPPHLPIASQWGPSSPPPTRRRGRLRTFEQKEDWHARPRSPCAARPDG